MALVLYSEMALVLYSPFIFIIAVILAVLFLSGILNKSKKKKWREEGNIFRLPMLYISLGFIAVFLPFLMYVLILMLGFPYMGYEYQVLSATQCLGGAAIALGLKRLRKESIRSGQRISGILPGIWMGWIIVLAFLFLITQGGIFFVLTKPVAAILFVFSLIMAITLTMLGKNFTCFYPLAGSLYFLALLFLFLFKDVNADCYVIDVVLDYNSYFLLVTGLAILLVTVFSFWLMKAKPKESQLKVTGGKADTMTPSVKGSDGKEEIPAEATVEKGVEKEISGDIVATSTSGNIAEERAERDDILQKIMGYDDLQLKKIIERPKFYKAEVVAKARELLQRREAWEQIKDLDDAELLDMTISDQSLLEDNIVEAASMELYQRDSQLLYNRFASLTPDIIAAIANGTAPAPEGIRLAARRFLSRK